MNKIKNKRGFTLIEVLAVIVVLAIILVITVPTVTSAINTSRNRAFIEAYENLIGDVQSRIIQKKTNKSVQIECADTNNLREEFGDIDTKCKSLYEISEDDYQMHVLLYKNLYYVILEGYGKFANIDYEKNAIELLKKQYYPFNHELNINEININDELNINDLAEIPSYSKNSLMAVISKNGKVLNLLDELAK